MSNERLLKSMGVFLGGTVSSALLIGTIALKKSNVQNGMTFRSPVRPLASPCLVLGSAITSLSTTYFINNYLRNVK